MTNSLTDYSNPCCTCVPRVKYILKGGTEDVCSVPNLLYKFNSRYYASKYLEEPTDCYSIPHDAKNHKYWVAVRHYATTEEP